MPRFALLEHDWPEQHFDLFLEAGSELQSWKLPADFSPLDDSPILSGAPHRLLYLDYEGEVCGDRGTVTRWDSGEFHWVAAGRAHFFGRRLIGLYEWVEREAGLWRFGPIT